jgi:hypothetical protein
MVQIVGCGRTIGGGVVAFHIEWDGDLPGESSVLWSMEISNGEESVHLGHQRNGGEFVAQFVDASSTGGRADVPEDADLGGTDITARFPEDVVGVAVEWPVWKALIVVDGAEVASEVCTTTP